MNRHWTLDELTDHMYGIRDANEHLGSCRECAERLTELNRRRAALATEPDITKRELAAQRSAVIERAMHPSRRFLRWAPVPALTAAAGLLAVALFVHHSPQVAPQADETAVAGEAQLFSDIYNIEESAEPLAAAPIHELFQEGHE